MTYVRQNRLSRNKAVIALGVIIVLSLAGITFYFTGASKRVENKEQLDTSMVQQDKLSVVRAVRAVQPGESADVSNFEVISMPKEMSPTGAVSNIQQLKGKIVVNSLEDKEILMLKDLALKADYYEQDDRLIEHAFQEGAIPKSVEVGSVVDIKLFRPLAEDAVVVSKTVVISKVENTLSFYLNSIEQENIKEAGSEGLIFMVQYLDKLQPSSTVTYTPSYVKGFAESSIKGK
jgi:hypothetical protein